LGPSAVTARSLIDEKLNGDLMINPPPGLELAENNPNQRFTLSGAGS
jgi:hypothetical protein